MIDVHVTDVYSCVAGDDNSIFDLGPHLIICNYYNLEAVGDNQPRGPAISGSSGNVWMWSWRTLDIGSLGGYDATRRMKGAATLA